MATVLAETWPEASQALARFSYDLCAVPDGRFYRLFRAEELLIDNITMLPRLYLLTTPAGDKLVGFVRMAPSPGQDEAAQPPTGYLILDEQVQPWTPGAYPIEQEIAPIFAAQGLLLLQVDEKFHVHVVDAAQEDIFTFATLFAASVPIRGFTSWRDHWILEVDNFVIVDGEILNEKFGFEEVFGWQLIDGKPFYFFRKGPEIGIAYDGDFYPVHFDAVAHNLCCGLRLNNPLPLQHGIRFFGKKNGVWHRVVIKIDS